MTRRQYEWRDIYETREIEGTGGLTRNQGRAIEQVIKEQNPNYYNINNSISPSSPYYQPAKDWALDWLERNKVGGR